MQSKYIGSDNRKIFNTFEFATAYHTFEDAERAGRKIENKRFTIEKIYDTTR